MENGQWIHKVNMVKPGNGLWNIQGWKWIHKVNKDLAWENEVRNQYDFEGNDFYQC